EGEAPVKVRARVEGRDSDGRVTALTLDFNGDGTSDETTAQNALEANWTYGTPGTYVIRATVTDDRGATTSAVATITVRAAPNEAPTGSLTVNTTSGDAPVRVHLQAEGSDADGQIVKWEIDDDRGSDGFAEFTPAQGVDVEYAFREMPYRPRLRVTDNRGATTTVVGSAITVYRPVSASRSTTASTGNARFESLSIAPAIWADGQDRLRFSITVRDAAGKPVAGVPLRVRSLRPDLIAPDGTDLGGTLTIALDGTVTDAAGMLTGALTTTTSSRVFAAPSPGVLVPFDLKVEADVGHETWRRLPDLSRLNAETVVSGTVGDGQFFIKPQGLTCIGQTVEIHVRGMRRGDAPSPGGPAAGRYTEVRFSQSGGPLPGIVPLSGYEDWRTDANGFMKFRYSPSASDSRTLKAWVDGQPLTIDTALAVVQC
ncbi:MAG: PKD domain-containing protein, partial [Gemmatimonadota bacterium]